MKYLLFSVLLLLFSCNKDATSASNNVLAKFSFEYLDASEREERTNQVMDYLEPSLTIDYKKDFLIANIPDYLLDAKPSDLEVRLLKIAGDANEREMQGQYEMVKRQLKQWLSENSSGQYTSTIQHVSLRYLRFGFLEENSTVSKKEVEFLLKVLIDLKAEDLDVLADAYHQIQSNLSESDQKSYYNYLQSVYHKNLALISDKAPEYKVAYKAAKDNPADRLKYLMYGKDLERRSKSCVHADELLDFSTMN